jgi:triosephosphate isomerase
LAGHSERRHTLKYETDADVAIKTKRILEAGMTPIVCIGETKAQRDLKQTNEVTARQLKALKDNKNITMDDWSKIVVAYEPVWAIGTGVAATPADA